jgi:hypothetical protein
MAHPASTAAVSVAEGVQDFFPRISPEKSAQNSAFAPQNGLRQILRKIGWPKTYPRFRRRIDVGLDAAPALIASGNPSRERAAI